MKVKIKLKICQFNELVSVATAYTRNKFYTVHWSNVQKLNLRGFIYFGLKKQIEWGSNNEWLEKNKTLTIDINHFEALKHIFNLERDNVGDYPKAIFWGLTEQVNKQINQKLILLSNYE